MDFLKLINQKYMPELLIIRCIFTYIFKKIVFCFNYTNENKINTQSQKIILNKL